MKTIIYEAGQLKRPYCSKKTRLFLKLNSLPLIGNNKYVKKAIIKAFNFPVTTTFNEGFFCSAPNISIGENVGLADTYILAYAPVTIGDNCSFSFRNMIITSTHDINNFSTVMAKPIIIGNNVWITTNVLILPGVTIGNNTVIGAGSVVTKNIPANVFATGNPCKVIKTISFKK
jgi:maltose O-acetyltransferase